MNTESKANAAFDALNAPSASDLTIEADIVTGVFNGIKAQNQGSGVTSVTTTGLVTGGDTGISVSTLGTGTTIIKATGDVVGTAGAGIDVSNGSGAGAGVTGDALTVEVFNVSGRTYGILATNNGAGSTSIIAKGDVTGTGYDGIRVVNEALANNLTIGAYGIVEGGNHGIFAENNGTGSTSITTTGDVTGTRGSGISAFNGELAKDLTIVANGNVTGDDSGITVINGGTGTTKVTTLGDVEATDAFGLGVFVGNDESASDIIVAINGKVTSGDDGIEVENAGRGLTSITVTGDVDSGDDGIYVQIRGSALFKKMDGRCPKISCHPSIVTTTRKVNELAPIRIDQPAMELMGNHSGLD